MILLSQKIRYCFYDCRQLYGCRRLAEELTTADHRVSHTTVAKYMRQMGLRSKFYPTYCTTTDSNHSNNVVDNLLDRKVVGYSISRTMKASDTVILAFKVATKTRMSSPNYSVNIIWLEVIHKKVIVGIMLWLRVFLKL